MQKTVKTKLLARHHTGKIREHKHTSYGSLLLLVLLTAIPLIGASYSASSADVGDTSGGGNYSTFAVVPGAIPKVAPVIQSPRSGQIVTNSDPLPISGSCPTDTMVKIFSNDVLMGAALCQNSHFAISIAPFVGTNTIIALAYNTNDVASPDSQPVSVQLNLRDISGAGIVSGVNQLFITSEIYYRGGSVGEKMTWPITLAGGQPPYAVNVSWGDGKTDLISRGTSGRFDISHVYDKPGGYRGSYNVMVSTTDSAGNKSFIQFVSIVSGKPQPVGTVNNVKNGYHKSAVIQLAWEGVAVAVLVIASFWAGEVREERHLKHELKHEGGAV